MFSSDLRPNNLICVVRIDDIRKLHTDIIEAYMSLGLHHIGVVECDRAAVDAQHNESQ